MNTDQGNSLDLVSDEQWAEWRAKWQADKVRWEKLHIPGKRYDTEKTSDTTEK